MITNWIGNIVNYYRIRRINEKEKGVEQFKSITTDVLFPPGSCGENIIISGGDIGQRLRFSERIIENSHVQGRPMIVLHLANSGLENIIVRNNWGVVVNRQNKKFDAFTSFNLQEICQVVLDTCKSRYDIRPEGRYILQAVHELLACKKIRPYFSNFADFPYPQLDVKINDCLTSGLITQDTNDNLVSLNGMGQHERNKIDTFFYDMKAQINHIATDDANSTGGISILSAIKNGKILCIDLNSSANVMLVELIVNSLNIAMRRGIEFTLFLDDVPIANNEMLKNTLCQRSRHNNIICSKDLYAMLSGNNDAFTTITGLAETTVLSSHGSHISCEKWSKYIGEYDKIDVSQNRNAGWGHRGFNTSKGQTMTYKREYRVKPEQINCLFQGVIIKYNKIIHNNQTGALIHTKKVL